MGGRTLGTDMAALPGYNEKSGCGRLDRELDRWSTASRSMIVAFDSLSKSEQLHKDKLMLGLRSSHYMHLPIGSPRIAKHSLAVMTEAGIDTTKFKAHSVRGASAQEDLGQGATPDVVMQRGRWRSYTVFSRFYSRYAQFHQVDDNTRRAIS